MLSRKYNSTIKAFTSRFEKSEFFRNTTILTSGTALAQFISVFTAPILTRLYFPADYGLLGIYMIFSALIATVSTLQYHNAIITESHDDKAQDILELSLLINLLVSVLALVFVFFCRTFISSVYHQPQLSKWLVFVPASVFFVGVNAIFSAWAIRRKQFKLLTYNRIVSALLAPVFSIVIGYFILGPLGLFVGLLVSQVLPTLRMTYYFFRSDNFKLHFQSSQLKEAWKLHRNFPLFSLPSEFVNNLSNQLPIMMLSQVGGIRVVGWYNLSVRMLGLPTSLVSTSIADVFRQRASYDYNKYGSCRPIFMKVFRSLLAISILPVLIVVLFGPSLFAFVFGERWREAGAVAQVLSVLYAFRFVISPLSYVTYIARKQWVGLILDVVLLLTLLTVIWAANYFSMSYKHALLVFSLSYSFLYLLTFYLSYKFTVNGKFLAQGSPAVQAVV